MAIAKAKEGAYLRRFPARGHCDVLLKCRSTDFDGFRASPNHATPSVRSAACRPRKQGHAICILRMHRAQRFTGVQDIENKCVQVLGEITVNDRLGRQVIARGAADAPKKLFQLR